MALGPVLGLAVAFDPYHRARRLMVLDGGVDGLLQFARALKAEGLGGDLCRENEDGRQVAQGGFHGARLARSRA